MMRRNLILHVGRHKTGTTSLQRFFSINDQALLDRYSLLYPSTGRANHAHHPLFPALLDGDHGLHAALLDPLKKEVVESGASTVLMSSESLSKAEVTRERLGRIMGDFPGCSIRVVVYLRRQDDYLESAYAEMVKRGGCAFPQGIHSFDFDLDHCAHVRKFADVFGKHNVIVRPYVDHESFDIYRDFMGTIDCTWSESLRTPPRRLNTRLPWLYIELLRYGNLTVPTRNLMHLNAVRKLFVRLGKAFPWPMDFPRPLSREERQELMQRYESSNREVARLYLHRDRLFPDSLP